MSASFHRRIPNTLEDLSACMQDCRAYLEEGGTPDEVIFAVELTLEEMITNTIKYGYRDEGMHHIDVGIRLGAGKVSVEICDEGEAFDPFSQEEPDTSLPAEERPVGGLGIHLVKNMLDSCHYAREGGKNIVRVEKNWPANNES